MPKPRHFYEALESAVHPKTQNILTADDGDYWKAVRQGAAPCFSVTNMKKVGGWAITWAKKGLGVEGNVGRRGSVDSRHRG
jgi:hypothetical protein